MNVLLLDIGNVVLGIDFRRVFAHWAASAGVDVQRFYDHWELDDFYVAHEVGEIDFVEYCASLQRRFSVSLTPAQWEAGWNDLWTAPFGRVIALLPDLAERYQLYAFSNTNPTHEAYFRAHFAAALKPFRQVFTSSTLGQRKPQPDAYRAVCADIGVEPMNVTFIDDNTENVTGAQLAGLTAHLCAGEEEVTTALTGLLQQGKQA